MVNSISRCGDSLHAGCCAALIGSYDAADFRTWFGVRRFMVSQLFGVDAALRCRFGELLRRQTSDSAGGHTDNGDSPDIDNLALVVELVKAPPIGELACRPRVRLTLSGWHNIAALEGEILCTFKCAMDESGCE